MPSSIFAFISFDGLIPFCSKFKLLCKFLSKKEEERKIERKKRRNEKVHEEINFKSGFT